MTDATVRTIKKHAIRAAELALVIIEAARDRGDTATIRDAIERIEAKLAEIRAELAREVPS